jgi:Fe-S-cluster containining protein
MYRKVEMLVKFRCLCDGQCCKKYWIPVTHLDLLRLKIYGGIEVDESIVELKDREIYNLDIYPPIVIGDKEYFLALVSKDDGSCVFLRDDGKCSVHEYKPLVCRFYPFVYYVKDDGEIGIDVNEKAVGECPGLVMDGEPIDRDMVENLKKITYARREELKLWSETINEWNNSYGSKVSDLGTFLKFSLDKAEKHMKELVKRGIWIK